MRILSKIYKIKIKEFNKKDPGFLSTIVDVVKGGHWYVVKLQWTIKATPSIMLFNGVEIGKTYSSIEIEQAKQVFTLTKEKPFYLFKEFFNRYNQKVNIANFNEIFN